MKSKVKKSKSQKYKSRSQSTEVEARASSTLQFSTSVEPTAQKIVRPCVRVSVCQKLS